MNKTALAWTACAALAVAGLHAGPAQALNPKSWVANTGNDGFDCHDVANACQTLQRAHDQTQPGGEVGVVNAGDYSGTLTPRLVVSKTISISNDGVGEAGIVAHADGDGIYVNAGNGDVNSLRGLVIEGAIGGFIGVQFGAGSALHVQNCVIRNMQGPSVGNGGGIGIWFTGVNSQLFVSDTIILNSGTGANTGGILIQPIPTGGISAVLDRVHLENNVVGLLVDSTANTANGAHVVVRDSVISGNATDGIRGSTTPGHGPAFLFVERTTLVNNGGNGIRADGHGATVLLNDSTITRNGTGVSTVNGGQLISYGNNRNNNNIGAEGVATSSDPLL